MPPTERNPENEELLLDLLIKRLGEPLSPDEQRLLDQFSDRDAIREQRELQRAAAALALAAAAPAAGQPLEGLPEALRMRLQRHGEAFFAASAPGAAASVSPRQPADGNVVDLEARRSAPQPLPSYSAWWVAAACLAVGAFGWLRSPAPAAPPASAALAPAQAPTLAEQRLALMAAPSAAILKLGATKDPAGAAVSGDVVWDPATQRGYIRFVGLAPNDPGLQQYQVWIFDAERDQRYPVDGGVFDIPAGESEVVVPIHAKISVRTAKAFAVTLEKAGGVVVSARDRVVALAQAT
jgi:hypothetical protein